MNISDIVLIFRFRNSNDLIDRFMHYNMQYCDCFVAIDDRSTDTHCYDKLKGHPKCAYIAQKTSKCNFSEVCDRESLHSMALTTRKQFSLYLDLDEILDESFIDELGSIPENDYYTADMITLYPDEHHYITQGIYVNHKTTIISRMTDGHYNLSDIDRLHTSRFPTKTGYDTYHLSSKIYHFSLCSSSRIMERYEFYKLHDPHSIYQKKGYDHFLRKYKYSTLDKKWEI